MNENLGGLIEQKQNLDRLYHRLLRINVRPVMNPRNIVLSKQREILTPKYWRKTKSNVQTLAGRSFKLLQDKFEESLIFTLDLYRAKEINRLELQKELEIIYRKYYYKSYTLGLKSIGLGISQNYNEFQRLSKMPHLNRQDYDWLETSTKDKDLLFNEIAFSRIKKIPIQFLKLLRLQYDYGRVMGSPAYSLGFWKPEKGNSCKLCSYMYSLSPWPLEKLPILPVNCKNCSSSLNIYPRNSIEYNENLLRFEDFDEITQNIKTLLVQ